MPTSARPPRRIAGPLLVTAALAVLAGCGGGGGSSAGGTATASTTTGSGSPSSSAGGSASRSQSLTATEADFSIDLDQDTLAAGTYEVTVVNQGSATHDLVVERDGADVAQSDTIRPGDTSTFTVTLEPGTYVFYCSIGNHRAMGMQTEVTVT